VLGVAGAHYGTTHFVDRTIPAVRSALVGELAPLPGFQAAVFLGRLGIMDVDRFRLGHALERVVKPDPAIGYAECLQRANDANDRRGPSRRRTRRNRPVCQLQRYSAPSSRSSSSQFSASTSARTCAGSCSGCPQLLFENRDPFCEVAGLHALLAHRQARGANPSSGHGDERWHETSRRRDDQCSLNAHVSQCSDSFETLGREGVEFAQQVRYALAASFH